MVWSPTRINRCPMAAAGSSGSGSGGQLLGEAYVRLRTERAQLIGELASTYNIARQWSQNASSVATLRPMLNTSALQQQMAQTSQMVRQWVAQQHASINVQMAGVGGGGLGGRGGNGNTGSIVGG